jgi:hypothetical protein
MNTTASVKPTAQTVAAFSVLGPKALVPNATSVAKNTTRDSKAIKIELSARFVDLLRTFGFLGLDILLRFNLL